MAAVVDWAVAETAAVDSAAMATAAADCTQSDRAAEAARAAMAVAVEGLADWGLEAAAGSVAEKTGS